MQTLTHTNTDRQKHRDTPSRYCSTASSPSPSWFTERDTQTKPQLNPKPEQSHTIKILQHSVLDVALVVDINMNKSCAQQPRHALVGIKDIFQPEIHGQVCGLGMRQRCLRSPVGTCTIRTAIAAAKACGRDTRRPWDMPKL